MKNTSLKNAAAATAIVVLGAALRAGNAGSTGANFLKVGVGARSLAMGGAAVSSVDDANAIYWNPSRLATVEKPNVTATYASLFEDQSQGFLGFSAPWQDLGTLGVGVDYLSVKNIEKRAGDTDSPDGTVKDQEYAIFLSLGRKEVIFEPLALGGNLKMVRQTLDTLSNNAYAMDLGAHYRLAPWLNTGLSVQNLGSKLGPDSLPLLVKAGMDTHWLNDRLIVALDGDGWIKDQRTVGALGVEYRVVPPLALRAGYRFGEGNTQLGGGTGLSAGVGFNVLDFNLDYAFVPAGDLQNTHRVTFGAKF